MITLPHTERFNSPGVSPRVPSEMLTKAMSWVQTSQNVPPQLALAIGASLWMAQVLAFRQEEEEKLDSGEYENCLDDHRFSVIELIHNGEQFVFGAKKLGFPRDFNEFTLADLEAAVESLHMTFRSQHGPRNHPEVNSSIMALLNG